MFGGCSWPSGFYLYKHSSLLLDTEQLLHTRYMWSFPMIAAVGELSKFVFILKVGIKKVE
jgi:hypothetical protein